MISVVLADDHTILREGLRLLLEAQNDIRVLGEAGSGSEAIQLVQQLRPHVVVMDVGMPELNGVEAARRVHEHSPGTAILMLSMHDSSEHVLRALDAGARGYLLKQAAARELVEAVRAVHAGQRYLSPALTELVVDDYLRSRRGNQPRSGLEGLSVREREILSLVVNGHSSSEIASVLSLSPKTVDTYRSRLMRKLHLKDMLSLAQFAMDNGLTPARPNVW
jgi:DNA-binding NarL/FixJ family response regulator